MNKLDKTELFKKYFLDHIKFNNIFRVSRLYSIQIATIILGFITSILWARFFPQDVFGEFQFLISIIAIANGICFPGFSETIIISSSKEYEGNFTRIVAIKFGFAIFGSLLILLYGYISNKGINDYFFIFIILALFFPFQQFSTIWNSWFIGKNKLELTNILNLSINVVWAVLLVIFILFKNQSIMILLIGYYLIYALYDLVILYKINKSRKNKIVDNASIKYGIHASLATIFASLILTDKLLIKTNLSSADVAIYSVAMIFPNQIRTGYGVLNQILMPKIYKAKSVLEGWHYLKNKIILLFISFILIGLAGFLIFPIIIPLFFSQKYINAVPYGKWLWLSLSIVAPTTYFSNILKAQQKIFFYYFFSIIQPILTFLLYLLLIRYGIKGIVLSRILMQFVTGFIFLAFFIYYLNKKGNKI